MGKRFTERQIQFEIYQELGECYAHIGKQQEAIRYFNQALNSEPQSEKPHIGLGVVALQGADLARAKEYFLQAVRLNPRSDKALSGLGMALSTNGSREEGMRKFREALDLNPENVTALMGLLESASILNQLAIIEIYLRKYLELHTADLRVLYCLAGVWYKLGRYREAQEAVDKILVFEPENQDVLFLQKQIKENLS
jgi:tetratricopeptide (TPR) repeat protein